MKLACLTTLVCAASWNWPLPGRAQGPAPFDVLSTSAPLPTPSLHLARGAWRISWSSGLNVNFAFIPNLSKANLTYTPDLSFRTHVIRLTATLHFF